MLIKVIGISVLIGLMLLLVPLPIPEDTHTRELLFPWTLISKLMKGEFEEIRFRITPILLSHLNQQLNLFPVKLRVREGKSILKLKPGDPLRMGLRYPIPSNVKRILLIRPDRLGDMVISLPLMYALRFSFPEADVYLIAQEAIGQLPKAFKLVDKVISPEDAVKLRSDLTADLAINLQSHYGLGTRILIDLPATFKVLFQTALPPRLNERIASSLTVTPVEPKLHVIDALKVMGELLTGKEVRTELPDLSLPESVEDRLDEILSTTLIRRGLSEAIVIAPFAGVPAREWLLERYMELADVLTDSEYQVILVGTVSDLRRLRGVTLPREVVNLIGKLDILTLTALIKRVRLVITNDTGIAHLSSFLRTPVLVIAGGLTNPVLWYPYWGKVRVIYNPTACSECHKFSCPHQRCLKAISVQQVIGAVHEMLGVKTEKLLRA